MLSPAFAKSKITSVPISHSSISSANCGGITTSIKLSFTSANLTTRYSVGLPAFAIVFVVVSNKK